MDDGSKVSKFVTDRMVKVGAEPERGSPEDMERRDRMIELASRLADETRTVFYVGWGQTRWRWLVSNDREMMVRECLMMEALAPDWATLAMKSRETRQDALDVLAMGREIEETDRRAEEFNQVHSDEDPQVKVVRVLEYRGSQSDVLKMLKASTVNESKGIVVNGVEVTELIRVREVL